jgi:hypothetical protein
MSKTDQTRAVFEWLDLRRQRIERAGSEKVENHFLEGTISGRMVGK